MAESERNLVNFTPCEKKKKLKYSNSALSSLFFKSFRDTESDDFFSYVISLRNS